MNGKRNPEPVGALLDGVLRRLGVARPVGVTQLVSDWPTIAGEPWASRSRPVGLRDGVLSVEVADSTAATLLKYDAKSLVSRLEKSLGKGLVTEVRVQVGRRSPDS